MYRRNCDNLVRPVQKLPDVRLQGRQAQRTGKYIFMYIHIHIYIYIYVLCDIEALYNGFHNLT